MRPKLHVLLRKEEIDPARLPGKIAVVLDVLFATSAIAAALAHGAADVVPALDETDARAKARGLPEGSYLLAGEKNIRVIDGFASPFPLALAGQELAGRRLVYATTNGTVALCGAETARRTYAAALVNGPAVVRHLLARHQGETVVLVCAGSGGRVNVEDLWGAGYLVDLLAAQGEWDYSDAALAAHGVYRANDPSRCLLASRVGRIVGAAGHADEVRYAAQLGILDVVPVLERGVLRATRPS